MGDYHKFTKNIKNLLHIDLDLYKEAQMKRRLTSFRDKKNFSSFHDFFNELKVNNTLQAEFLDRVTINVSEFFRNMKRWEILEKKIIPNLLKTKKNLSVWSAACSTGEEPYTLSIILSEYLPLDAFTILASDLDAEVIAKAKQGKYVEHSLKEVPQHIKTKYFTKTQDTNEYIIQDHLKQPITFRVEDLFQTTFTNKFDLIVCRNVFIYFTEEAKQQLYHKFHRALKEDGILFVGSTEQIFQPQKYGFAVEETFFYRKI